MKAINFVSGFIIMLTATISIMAADLTIPHVFQPNTKAKASEVNANFEAVRNAINDNENRIGSLESSTGDHATRIQNLESKKILSKTYGPECFSITFNSEYSTPKLGDELETNPVIILHDFVYLVDANGTDNVNSIYCPIALPEGVKILKIIATVYDNVNTGNITVRFGLRNHLPIGGSYDIGASSDDAQDQNLEKDLSSENVVVQRGGRYFLSAVFSTDTAGNQLRLEGVTIIYEYDPTYSGPAP